MVALRVLPLLIDALEGRKLSRSGASARSLRSEGNDNLPPPSEPDKRIGTNPDLSEQELDAIIKDMKGSDDMPQELFVMVNNKQIEQLPDGRTCRLCPRRDDQWDPVYLAVFRTIACW